LCYIVSQRSLTGGNRKRERNYTERKPKRGVELQVNTDRTRGKKGQERGKVKRKAKTAASGLKTLVDNPLRMTGMGLRTAWEGKGGRGGGSRGIVRGLGIDINGGKGELPLSVPKGWPGEGGVETGGRNQNWQNQKAGGLSSFTYQKPNLHSNLNF